jgi:hypothetical protein
MIKTSASQNSLQCTTWGADATYKNLPARREVWGNIILMGYDGMKQWQGWLDFDAIPTLTGRQFWQC